MKVRKPRQGRHVAPSNPYHTRGHALKHDASPTDKDKASFFPFGIPYPKGTQSSISQAGAMHHQATKRSGVRIGQTLSPKGGQDVQPPMNRKKWWDRTAKYVFGMSAILAGAMVAISFLTAPGATDYETGDGLSMSLPHELAISYQQVQPMVEEVPIEPPDIYAVLEFEPSEGLTFIGSATSSLVTSQTSQAVVEAIALIEDRGNDTSFVMIDLASGLGLAYNADERFYAASSIKGPYVASVVASNPGSLDANYYLMESILKYSDNDAYDTLYWSYLSIPIQEWFYQAHTSLNDPNPMYPHYSARDLARVWQRTYEFFLSGLPSASELAQLFTSPANSLINSQLGWLYTTYSKAGWFSETSYYQYDGYDEASEDPLDDEDPDGVEGLDGTEEVEPPVFYENFYYPEWTDPSAVDAGIVIAGDRPYLVVVMSDLPGYFPPLYPLMEALNTAHDEIAAYSLAEIARMKG
jgi:hypothetical protein